MTRRTLFLLPLMLLCLFPVQNLLATEPPERVLPRDGQKLSLTIYPNDLALVRDQRTAELKEGRNRLAFEEVSTLLRPETALVQVVGDPNDQMGILETNYEFDLLTPEALLETHIGKTVRAVRTHPETGEETEQEATILSAANGIILQIGDRIETEFPGRIVYPDLPATLRHRPTLAVEVMSPSAGTRQLALTYLTGGISWEADYAARLSPRGDTLDLSGFVTLTNRSGIEYPDADLQFVAGDVHRIQEPFFRRDTRGMEALAAAAPQNDREQAFEYYLYPLKRPTTLNSGQTKQVALMAASGVPVLREYLLRGQEPLFQGRPGDPARKEPIHVFLTLENTLEEGLGQPLPEGTVRVYQEGGEEEILFIGEDRIGNTPIGENIRLNLGTAFDLRAERTRTAFERLPSPDRSLQVFEIGWRIVLKNAKEEQVTVRVVEPIPGAWEILQESLPHTVEGKGEAVWEVAVPAQGERALEYTARIKI